LWEVGRYVYRYGDPFENIPPCMTCHGKDARGSKTLPRLAGQHRKYIVNQLLAFQSGKRKTTPEGGSATAKKGENGG